MKYSVLSIAPLVAPALGNPAYFWRQYLSHPIYPADAGTVKIENFTPFNIQVDAEPLGDHFTIPPGQPGSVPGAFSEDVKFNEQVEVSYVSGDQGTFNYVIQPINGGGFPGCVSVSPNGCGSQTLCPGQPPTPPVTCKAGTELPVTLYIPCHMRKTAHEFLL
ncbi:hypothetical protein BDV24DRAFT_130571 [Aspergillus arachidicola]|uniref:Uncharacterized protein n=1 Tax=Aspergillus arachidicola TaxID=656916 RepID=A0A5N6YG56_9EURO|nr:hypothetical protein BDV24DRAFT_130571 [Aspergillus arachidicola]